MAMALLRRATHTLTSDMHSRVIRCASSAAAYKDIGYASKQTVDGVDLFCVESGSSGSAVLCMPGAMGKQRVPRAGGLV